MEHLVGIKIKDKLLGEVGFITWGRLFHPVDEKPLLDAVAMHAAKFGIFHLEDIALCNTLLEVSSLPYFYEALFEFSQKTIPDSKKYKAWCATKRKKIKQGEEIYFLGLNNDQRKKGNDILNGAISHGFWYKE